MKPLIKLSFGSDMWICFTGSSKQLNDFPNFIISIHPKINVTLVTETDENNFFLT